MELLHAEKPSVLLRLGSVTAGNPLFGWWELGSAIIGDMDERQDKVDFSPATPRNEEAGNFMRDVVPFALVTQR